MAIYGYDSLIWYLRLTGESLPMVSMETTWLIFSVPLVAPSSLSPNKEVWVSSASFREEYDIAPSSPPSSFSFELIVTSLCSKVTSLSSKVTSQLEDYYVVVVDWYSDVPGTGMPSWLPGCLVACLVGNACLFGW